MPVSYPRNPNYLPRRINRYVPGLQVAADITDAGTYRVSLGTPTVASANAILLAPGALTSGAVASFTTMTGALGDTLDATFGRNVTVSGTSTRVLTVTGRDYLGQPMKENITMSTGTISGVKAFKWIDSLSFSAVADTVNPTVGVGDVLGLPYTTTAILLEEASGDAQSAGTFVEAVRTDPQTATTGDPRGTYNPTVTLDGAKEVVVVGVASAIFGSGNVTVGLSTISSGLTGGLHGVKQYFA